eukprot:1159563-Pelagomonas_calceolata.AAC.3
MLKATVPALSSACASYSAAQRRASTRRVAKLHMLCVAQPSSVPHPLCAACMRQPSSLPHRLCAACTMLPSSFSLPVCAACIGPHIAGAGGLQSVCAASIIVCRPCRPLEVARKKRREREFGQREPPPGMGMDPRDHRDFGDAWRSSGLEPLAYHGPSAALPPPPALPLPPPRSPPRSNSRRGELPDNSWGRRRR